MENKYPSGIYINKPRDNAPSFVKGSIAVQPSKAVEYLKQFMDKPYIYFDVLEGKVDGKWYLKVNDYKKSDNGNKNATEVNSEPNNDKEIDYPEETISPEDIPF